MNNNYAVEIENLFVNYSDFVAIKDVSIKVKNGEIYGLLGHNGAGKTTIINVLSTLKKINKGRIEILGYKLPKEGSKIRENITLLSQTNSLDTFLSVYDNFYFYSWLQKIPRKVRKTRILEIMEIFNLTEKKDAIVSSLSGGTYRRVQMAKIFLSDAKIFLLDEPTLAFDVVAKKNVWNFLKEVRKKLGITIILSTNDLAEAENMCDRISFLKNGELIKSDTLNNLKAMLEKIYLSIDFERNGFSEDDFRNSIPNVNKVTKHENHVELELNLKKEALKISDTIRLLENKCLIKSINVRKPNLTDVFTNLNQGV